MGAEDEIAALTERVGACEELISDLTMTVERLVNVAQAQWAAARQLADPEFSDSTPDH